MEPYIQKLIIDTTKQYLDGAITAEEFAIKVLNILLGAGLIGGA